MKNSKAASAPDKLNVLYAGPAVDQLKEVLTAKASVHFIPCRTLKEIFDALNSEPIAVVCLCEFDTQDSLEILQYLQKKNLKPVRLVLSSFVTESALVEMINLYSIERALKESFQIDLARELLEEVIAEARRRQGRAQLLNESKKQMKELESLTQGLEAMVVERTQHIEKSQHEEEEKLSKIRTLIRFIKDLSEVTALEELMAFLRKDLRKFQKTYSPVLIIKEGSRHPQVFSYHQNQIFMKEPEDFSLDADPPQLSKKLANILGRPVGPVICQKLDLNIMNSVQAMICIESATASDQKDLLRDFLHERSESLAMTVERILLGNEVTHQSYRWEKTFDGFRDPIAIIDMDYKLLRSNKKFSDRAEERWTADRCHKIFAQRESPCEGCPVQRALKEKRPQRGTVQRSGRTYEIYSYPILLDEQGQVTNVVNQYVDVTQSRELYLRLLQSEKLGALGLLAGNIAHELNNPLTGLRSLAQILIRQTSPESSLHSDLVEIERATERSQQIIKNLRDFSQGVNQEKRLLSLDEVVEKTMPLLKTVIRVHRVELDLNSSQGEILVEPHLLQQATFNLVNNACQAMKTPGVLRISTGLSPGMAYLKIADTGPGIPPEIQGKIFEPFFTTKKEGLGTGLGLSLTKKIVESFGGRVSVSSVIGEGATFTIELPLVKKDVV